MRDIEGIITSLNWFFFVFHAFFEKKVGKEDRGKGKSRCGCGIQEVV